MTEKEGKSLEASKPRRAAALTWSCVVAGVLMFFMAAVAGPKLISARIPGNESAAIGALKAIGSSQQLHREQGHPSYADLGELSAASLVDAILGSGTKQGYAFACQASTADPASAWWASAIPLEPGESGERYFAVDQEGVVYYSPTAPIDVDPATCSMPPDAIPVGR